MPLGVEVGLGPCDFVLDGDPAPQKRRAKPPSCFWPMSIVAKLNGSIKMPLGAEVNVGSGDVVLDGVAAPPPP